jgi:signal recognition particle subunit SRP54
MTAHERREPVILSASRKRRIARGSGTTLQDVNRLIKQFGEMKKMMRQLGGAGGRRALMQLGRR